MQHDSNAAREKALAGLSVDDRRLNVAGVSTAMLEGGDGPPVVLLHGPGESALHWIRVIPALMTRHRVIAPDLPGQGATGASPHENAAHALAWLDELIRRTCESRPTLVGTTVGGAIAARFAAAHGDRLEGLVLVDTLGLTAFAPEPRFGQALNAFLARPDEETHNDLWRVCAYDVDRVRDAMGETWHSVLAYNLERIAAPETMAGVGALMQEFALQAIPAEELERIAVPTTLVWGRHDLATSLEVAEAASARFGWPLRVIEDCADAPAVEQPEALLAALETAMTSPMEVAR
jgi:pimeloyl-ACP methyl ester carboxylesterase